MRRAVLLSVACAALSPVLSACGTGGYVSSGNQGAGNKLFVDRCGGCHTLADAGTTGTIGPNLDDAFAQARNAGMTTETFTQVVADQIRFPISAPVTGSPGMPPPSQTLPTCDSVKQGEFCVDDQAQAIDDIATYVASVAGTGKTAEQPAG